MAKDRKTGKPLEKVVTLLERVLSGSPNVQVEPNKRLKDKVTGRTREHDVVLTQTYGHHTNILAIECRQRSRPVGSGDVEAFHTKCNHTGVNQGIIVSSTGFTDPARTKAAHLGIRCLEVAEVEKFDWLGSGEFTFQWINFDRIDMICQVGRPRVDRTHDFEILDPDGAPVSAERIAATIQNLVRENPRAQIQGVHSLPFRIVLQNHKLRDRTTGELRMIQCVEGTAAITVARAKVPFTRIEYGESEGSVIAKAAVATSTLPQFPGSFVLTEVPGQKVRIQFLIGPGFKAPATLSTSTTVISGGGTSVTA